MIRYSNERKKRDREKKREEKGYVKYEYKNKTAYCCRESPKLVIIIMVALSSI